jgi:EipB-like
MKRAFAVATALLALATGGASGGPAPRLASHRAIYEIALARTTGSNFVAAHGRLAVQFKDTCDGWSTAQRLIADMTDAKGVEMRTDFFITAWESKDGRTMRFDVSDSHDGRTILRDLAPDGTGFVDYAAQKHRPFALPRGTIFPTAQLLAVLTAAEAGRVPAKQIVFQGGNKSNLYLSTAIMGRTELAKLADERLIDRGSLLRTSRVWSALISFFPLSARAEQPDYEVATHLYANGINGSMTLIYPTYALRATLVRLEALHPSC